MKPGENDGQAEGWNGGAEYGKMIGKVRKARECPGNGGNIRKTTHYLNLLKSSYFVLKTFIY